MTEEERLLRLENALTTLSELAAKQNEPKPEFEQSLQLLAELASKDKERINQEPEWVKRLRGKDRS